MSMKVLISDTLCPVGVDILRAEPGIETSQQTGLKPDELIRIIGDYDALIVRSATQVTREVINAGKRLRVIGRAGIGVDNIDVQAATEQGIVVMNAPFGNTITTAEHAMSLLLSLTRHIPQAYACLRRHCWIRKCFMGTELYGKTLGIIGLGRIGREIAKRASALGMIIVASDPYVAPQDVQNLNLKLLPLNDLYRQADFITLHVPLNESTMHQIDAKAFSSMKKGVYIINCARGGIIDEAALYQALTSGQVAGVALDVFEQEPPADNPLLKLDNVICTPHLGASTKEAQEKVAVEIAYQIINLLKKDIVVNSVNTPSISSETLTLIKPYIFLAEGLGKLAGQLYPQPIHQLKIKYSGQHFKEHKLPITNTILQEILKASQAQPVNQVNAAFIAQRQHIEIQELDADQNEDYTQYITLELKAQDGDHMLAGTLLSNKHPRIINIDQFKLEITLQGYILIFFNQDQPGIIGNIGKLLGEHQINIADMQFGREKRAGKAISVFRIDSKVSEPLLAELSGLPHIDWVKQILL
jgi:D-3-phosphoglycerate dehydrogenase